VEPGDDAGACSLETKRDAISVLEFREGWNDLGPLDLQPAEPAQRVGDDPGLCTQLRFVAQMLQLAATTEIEVRAGRVASVRAGLDELKRARPRPLATLFDVLDLDPLAGCGSRDEDDGPFGSPGEAMTPGYDGLDLERFRRNQPRTPQLWPRQPRTGQRQALRPP
jgi:hypothetical protein